MTAYTLHHKAPSNSTFLQLSAIETDDAHPSLDVTPLQQKNAVNNSLAYSLDADSNPANTECFLGLRAGGGGTRKALEEGYLEHPGSACQTDNMMQNFVHFGRCML